jgi:hypothetical protein
VAILERRSPKQPEGPQQSHKEARGCAGVGDQSPQ